MTISFGSNPILDPDMASGRNPLKAIWNRRFIFAAVFLAVWGLAILALMVIPSSYLATGTVIIVEPERALNTPSAIMTQNIGDPADVESQVYIAGSPNVLRRVLEVPAALAAVIKDCQRSGGLLKKEGPDCGRFGPESPAAIAYLDDHYVVSGAGRSRVISISYNSPDPATAQLMANTLIDRFLASHRDEIARSQQLAVDSLAQQLDQLDADIRRESASVQTFRNKNDLLNGARSTMSSERLTSTLEQLTQSEAERSRAAAVLDAVKRGNLDEISALPAVIDSRVIADIKQQLSAAQEEAQSATSLFGPRHPRLQILNSRVDALRASLRQEIIKLGQNAQKRFDTADGVVKSLKAQMENAKAGVANAGTAESSLEDTIRDLEANKQQYAALSVQKQRLESDKLASLGRLRLVSPAEMPRQRFFPRTVPFVAGGLALAIVLATVIALFVDLRSAKHAAAGAIPQQAPEHDDQTGVTSTVQLPALDLPDTDPIRKAGVAIGDPKMRTALQRLLDQLLARRIPHRPLSVALVSAFAGEGRTLTTLMLANHAAKLGYRVLLVEADLHNPEIQSALGQSARARPIFRSAARSTATPTLRNTAGLQDILEGRLEPVGAVSRSSEGPDFITAGSGTANPTDLFGGDRISTLLDWARSYDLIFFDTPALNRHMDAGLLARQLDGAVFCFVGEKDEFEAVASIARRLDQLGVHILAYVAQDPAIEKEMAPVEDRSAQPRGTSR